jgi:hypothetical protein
LEVYNDRYELEDHPQEHADGECNCAFQDVLFVSVWASVAVLTITHVDGDAL